MVACGEYGISKAGTAGSREETVLALGGPEAIGQFVVAARAVVAFATVAVVLYHIP